MSISETVKNHPAASLAVLAIGVIILYSLIGGGSSAAAPAQSQGVSDNLQIAELNSATAIQGKQIEAAQADKSLGIMAQLQALALNAGLLGKYSDNDTALKVAGIQSGDTRFQVQAGADVSNHMISSQEAIALGQQKQVVDIAGITSAVNIAGINANRDTSIENTRALADANRYSAGLAHDTQTQQINAARHADNNKTTSDIFGNILGAAGALFSFL